MTYMYKSLRIFNSIVFQFCTELNYIYVLFPIYVVVSLFMPS